MKLEHLDQLRRQEREILFELENEEEARDRLNDKKLPYILEARLTSVQRIIMLRSILRRLRMEIAEEEMMIKVASFHDAKRDDVLQRIRAVLGADRQSEKSHEPGDARTDRARSSADEGVQPDPAGGGEHPRGDA